MIFLLVFCLFAQDTSWNVREEEPHDGLKLYTQIVPATKMVSVMFRYHLSSGVPDGAAHFVEHLMFSYRDGRQTYDQILEQMGGDSQGRTDLSSIKLNVHIPIESWDSWVRLEQNRQEFPCSNIEDDIFESQRMVIVQEYLQGIGIPERVYAQELRSAVFGSRGTGRSVIGSVDDISDWSKKQICEYMNQILRTAPVDVFVVGDVGGFDVTRDIQTIFSTSQHTEKLNVHEQTTVAKIKHEASQDVLYVLWPLPPKNHADTLFLRYWMMMMTHTRFGVLQKYGTQAKGWIEYGVQGGYLLFQLNGKQCDALEKDLRSHMYGFGGWMTAWQNASILAKVYHRSVVHSWKTLDGRLFWLEHCVQADILATCFEVNNSPSQRDLNRVKKQWLRWEQASLLRVVSP